MENDQSIIDPIYKNSEKPANGAYRGDNELPSKETNSRQRTINEQRKGS